jgi:hypothetical protein
MITVPAPHFSQPGWMSQMDDVTLSVDYLGDYNAVLTWNLHADWLVRLWAKCSVISA